jgi:glycosyltransferase involved in cell wall biosynthesis
MVVQRLLPYLAGAEIQALGLGAALERLGVDVRFLSTRYVAGLAAEETVRGLRVERLGVLRGPLLKPSQMVASALGVARRAPSFDLVHAHCLSSAALGTAIGAKLARKPVLVKPSLGGGGGEMAKLLESRGRPALLAILRGVDRFAALDEEIAGELRSVGIEPARIVRVDNGVDLERFGPASPSERRALRERLGLPDGPLALFAGQLVDRKAIVETLEAWRQVAATLEKAHLLVAGAGAREDVVREAAARGARVRYLGVVEDVADVMRASDALVLPSRNESFGNTIVEAMACGLPVVVGRTGVAASLRIDGIAGRVLDEPRPADIAAALGGILSAPNRGAEMGSRGRAMAARFGYERVARHYLEIYDAMLGVRRSHLTTPNSKSASA